MSRLGCLRFAGTANLSGNLGRIESLIALEGRICSFSNLLRYIDSVAVELLHDGSVLLLRDRVGVPAALHIVLPKVLLGRLVLILLVEHALELRLLDGRLGHERLPIG